MKIALGQINPTVGDISGNMQKIIDVISVNEYNVDILVFPELTLTGYPPQDLLFEPTFIESAELALLEIAKTVKECTVILGSIRRRNKDLFNTAAIIHSNGKIDYRDKTLLPTYDVFDETRYFTPSSSASPVEVIVDAKPVLLGVQICEDLWDNDYSQKVSADLVENGACLLINISASPFCVDRLYDRIQAVRSKVEDYNVPFFYCNLVGSQDELVFDGQSFAINSKSKIMAIAKSFDEDLLILDSEQKISSPIERASEESQIYSALTLGLKDYFNKTGHLTSLIGLSGGIDSALTCAIAVNALGAENVLGVAMPSKYSSDHSISDAELLAKNLGIKFEVISIDKINNQFLDSLSPIFSGTEVGVAEENLQARIRGNMLMSIANKTKSLLLNTSNKTELALGYSTLYGDMCGALAVISDLNKSQVYSLCRWINGKSDYAIIPEGTLLKPPSAELSYNQVDPFNYDIVSPLVDAIISKGIGFNGLVDEGFDPGLSIDISKRIRTSEYKRRQAVPGIRVSKKAFGNGRRYPIVNAFVE